MYLKYSGTLIINKNILILAFLISKSQLEKCENDTFKNKCPKDKKVFLKKALFSLPFFQ